MRLNYIYLLPLLLLQLCFSDMFESAKKGNLNAVEEYIKQGNDVNAQNSDEKTPLHYAAWEGHESIVRLLLDKGVDVNARNEYGKTPLDLADNDKIKALLKDYTKKQNQ